MGSDLFEESVVYSLELGVKFLFCIGCVGRSVNIGVYSCFVIVLSWYLTDLSDLT